MPKCTYCGKQYGFPRGMTVVDGETGRVRYFCSSKCRKYNAIGRKKGKWAGGSGKRKRGKKKKIKKKKKQSK